MGRVSLRFEAVLLAAAVAGCAPLAAGAGGGHSAGGKGEIADLLRNAKLEPLAEPTRHQIGPGEVLWVIDELGPLAPHGGPWDRVDARDGFPAFECNEDVSDCTLHHRDVGDGAAARIFEVAVEAAAVAAAVELAPEIAAAVGLAELFGGPELAAFDFYEVVEFGTLVAVSHDVIHALETGKLGCWSDKIQGKHEAWDGCEDRTTGPDSLSGPAPVPHKMERVVRASIRSILAWMADHSYWRSRVEDRAEDEDDCKPRWPWLIDAIEDGTYVPTPGAPEWWLDRIDQDNPQLDCKSDLVDRTGRGVRIYLVDAGISWIRRWWQVLECNGPREQCRDQLLEDGDPRIPEWMLAANEGKLEKLIRGAGPQIAGPQVQGDRDEDFGYGIRSEITNDHGLRTVSILHALVPEATLVDVNIWDPNTPPGQNIVNWARVKEAIGWLAADLPKHKPAVVSSNVWHLHGDHDLEASFEQISETAAAFSPADFEISVLGAAHQTRPGGLPPGQDSRLPFLPSRYAERVGGSYLYPDTFIGREDEFRGRELDHGLEVKDAIDVPLEDRYARASVLEERARLGLREIFTTPLGQDVRLLAPAMDILVASLWRRMQVPKSGWASQSYVYGNSWSLAMAVGAAAMYLEKESGASPAQVREAIYAAGKRMPQESVHGLPVNLLYLGKEAEAIWSR